MKKILKYGLAVIKKGKLLVVREYGTNQYLMPGGKPKKGENVVNCLRRELNEELGANLEVNSIKFYGDFEDKAANEPNTIVHIDLYMGEISGKIRPSGEIEEIRWIDKNVDPKLLSPIIRNKIMPSLVKDGIIK